ncbi:MAG: TolC family protein [Candidatus Obscuribacterales bacterium]|nr:TolC family protein [Candidatus Obscuribacterales bacterium]
MIPRGPSLSRHDSVKVIFCMLVATLATSCLPGASAQSQNQQNNTFSLKACFDRVIYDNPRAKAVRAKLGIAKSEIARATEIPNPGIAIDNQFIAMQEYTLGGFIPVGGPWIMAFQLLAAKKVVQKADLEIQRSLWLLRQETRRQYIQLLMAQERASTAKELTGLFQKVLNASQSRLNAGDIPKLDVLRAQLAYLQSLIDFERDNQQIVRARQLLNVLLAQSPHNNLSTPSLSDFRLRAEKNDILPDFGKPVPSLEYFLDLAMKNRLELKILEQDVKVNKSKLTASISKNFPNGFLSFGRSINGNPPTGPKLRGYFVAAEIQVPIFNLQQGDISLYRASIRQLRQELLAQRNIVTADVSDAYQQLLIARKQIEIYQDQALNVSKQVVQLAQLGYDAGQLDLNSVLLVQQANVEVRNRYLNAVSDYQQAFANLEQAVNIPLN